MERTVIDYLRLFRKRLWPIAAFVLLSCCVTWYVTHEFVVPVYQAKSKVLINSSYKIPDNNDVMMSLNLMESYKEILKSSNVVDVVAREHPEFGLTGDQLAKKLKVSAGDKTQIIGIAVSDKDYGKAVRIVNAVAETFIAEVPALMNMDNAALMSPADPAKRPAPENGGAATNLAVSFLLSLIVALGAAFFLENVNDTIRDEKEAAHYVGLPVLADIGTIKPAGGKRLAAEARTREAGDSPYVAVE